MVVISKVPLKRIFIYFSPVLYCFEKSTGRLNEDATQDAVGIIDDWVLEVDLAPFQRDIPKLKEQHSIGRGVEFLNRHLSNSLFTDAKQSEILLFYLASSIRKQAAL